MSRGVAYHHEPYPLLSEAGVARGHVIYQNFCLGCHSPIGDGMGPAQPFLYPPPLNFTILKGRGISGGILYYQIMNGITGTAMPYFKRDLESEKIWDVGNYVAVYFIDQSDANADPRGIEPIEPDENNGLFNFYGRDNGHRPLHQRSGFFWALKTGNSAIRSARPSAASA